MPNNKRDNKLHALQFFPLYSNSESVALLPVQLPVHQLAVPGDMPGCDDTTTGQNFSIFE